jgi:DNA-directed RNA polymerase beta subunit
MSSIFNVTNITDPVENFYTWSEAQQLLDNEKLKDLPPPIGTEILKSFRQVMFNKLVSEFGPVRNNTESYNHFLGRIMPLQVEMKPMHDDNGEEYVFKNVRIRKPMLPNGKPLFPFKARRSAMTYSGEIRADLYRKSLSEEPDMKVAENVLLGSIPIMLGSLWCHLKYYTPKELLAVFEDADDPFGYFIIKGSERLLVTQEKLGTAQQLTSEKDRNMFITRLTIPNINGTTVLMLTVGKTWPSIKFILCQSGMKSSISRKFPIFVLFDVMLQRIDPETFGYEMVQGKMQSRLPASITEEEIEDRRTAILEHTIKQISIFIPAEHIEHALLFLSASIAKYKSIRTPTMDVVKKRTKSTTVQVAAAQAAAAAPKRKAAAAVMATSIVDGAPIQPGSVKAATYPLSSTVLEMAALNVNKVLVTQFTISGVLKSDTRALLSKISKNAVHLAATDTDQASIIVALTPFGEKLFPPHSEEEQDSSRVETLVALAANHALLEIENKRKTSNKLNSKYGLFEFTDSVADIDNIIDEILNDMFVNVPHLDDKPIHLARLTANHILSCIGVRKPDNRDGWENKRLELPAGSLSQLFSGIFRGTVSSRGIYTPSTSLIDEFISSFGPRVAWGGRENISDMVKRDTPLALTSQIARINTPTSRQSKQIIMRMIQPSQVGFCCIGETPEGQACGLTKAMGCTMWNSVRRDGIDYISMILDPTVLNILGRPLRELTYSIPQNRIHPILVNNAIVGWCNANFLSRPLRDATKKHWEFFDVSVSVDPIDRVLEIYTTGSRPTRPLFVVNETTGQLVIDSLPGMPEAEATLSIRELVEAGAIQFISAREQRLIKLIEYPSEVHAEIQKRNEKKALHPEALYLELYSEIDPVEIFGVSSALMPVANTNHGPRVTYQAGMAKQSLGHYHDSYYMRMDTSFKRFDQPTRPTFDTRIAEPFGLTRCPTGHMFTLAFISLANNIEDGIVMQKEAVADLTITKYSTHRIIARLQTENSESTPAPVGVPVERIERPEEAIGTSKGSVYSSIYRTIGEDGLPEIGTTITKGSCIVGRVRTIVGANGSITRINASVFAGIGDDGVVDRVDVSTNTTSMIVRVRVRQIRGVSPGDKFASRYSQKGTAGAFRSRIGAVGHPALASNPTTPDDIEEALSGIRFAHDLPRIASGPNAGVVPDLFINPAAMPTRMTIGKLYECIASATGLVTGERFDATTFGSFNRDTVDYCRKTLEEHGLDRNGLYDMVHPDGTPLKAKVFIAPCYYQTLRHHALDKIQYRARGSVVQLTLQPVHGRSVEGGLRQGEMERAALLSHGATDIVRERLMLASDKYKLDVCATCGNHAIINPRLGEKKCLVCKDPRVARIGTVTCSFVSLLIIKILQGLGIMTKYSVKDADPSLEV